MISKRASKKILLYAVAALLVGSTAIAQQPGSGGMQQSQAPSQNYPTSPNSSMAPGAPDATNPQSFADQAFVKQALERSVAEVQLGQLAQQKSQSDDVKQYGQKMVQVHTQLD